MNFYFDPLDERCRSQRGAIARGSEITFRLYCYESGEGNFSAEACSLVFYTDEGETHTFPMQKTGDCFSLTLRFHEVGLFFYYFTLENGTCLGRGRLRRAEICKKPESWQVTVFDEAFTTPEWFKGGVMYQIFPDRFAKEGDYPIAPHKILRSDWGGQPTFRPNQFGKVLNNDFFGGNLNGICSKLEYLAELSVSTIYLNPIFEAYSNHRYDTGDYMKIDALLGTEEDFSALCKEGAKKGIRIVLDGVFNHTGEDSRYFNKYGRYESLGAYQSKNSPYSNWYTFRSFPDSYESWWGIETLPAINEQEPSYQEFIFGENGVLKTWLGRGASGYRLDVADELPGSFLQGLRAAVKEKNPEALIIGEVWEDASNKISYEVRRQYLQGYELDSVMNYPLKDAIINFVRTGSTAQLLETIAMLLDNYPKAVVDCLMNSLSTHDTPRILTVLGGKELATKEEMSIEKMSEEERALAKTKLRMAATLQYTLPGVPCLFYGDEVGVEGYMDPFCRACFPWNDIDESLRAFFVRLGEIRTKIVPEVFKDGDYRQLFADAACLVFERRKKSQTAVIWCNNSSVTYTLKAEGTYFELIGKKTLKAPFTLPAYSYGILIKQ
ncbi:MAG: glycoside hydrolase family 13 protein [Clostridia bacterium]|nr:glycoside hydrolase family 13 protein [Clostridia bacterium]